MQACRKTNQDFVTSPFTDISGKNKRDNFPIYSNEHREVRRGNTAFNEMLRRYSHALINTNELNNVSAPHVAELDE